MQSSKEYIRNVSAIHISMALGQILILIATIWVIDPPRDKSFDLFFQITDAILIVGGIIFAYYIYSKYSKMTRRMRGIREKLLTYRKGLLYQWITLECVTFVSILSFILTGAQVFVFASIFSLAVFIINRPSIGKTIEDLELDSGEKRILETPDAAI